MSQCKRYHYVVTARREVSVEECSLDKRMFLCNDSVLCIELFEVCNGHSDCLDNSDEGGLCNNQGESAHCAKMKLSRGNIV